MEDKHSNMAFQNRIEELIREGYIEITYHPDIDSIIALSMLIRGLGANSVNVGIISIYDLYGYTDIKDIDVGIGIPSISNKLIGIVKIDRKTKSKITSHKNIISTDSSITYYIYSNIHKFYKIPKELRSISIAGHLYSYSPNGLISFVDDRYVKDLRDLFGEDSIKIKNGLKIHRYGAGAEYGLSYILKNSLDPYIPLPSENIDRIVKEQYGGETSNNSEKLDQLAKYVNDTLKKNLIKTGLKPIYNDSYPFIDPYDVSICLNSLISIDPSSLALYISSGYTGIATISLKCTDLLNSILEYLEKLLISREIRGHTVSIKGVRMTIYPSIRPELVKPIHNILTSINHYQGTIPIYNTDQGYILVTDNYFKGEEFINAGANINSGGLVIFSDLEKNADVIKIWQE